MTDPALRLSVALCTFDGAEFLGRQLASILAQSSPPDDMVIADDGSTDDTLEIVDRFVAEASFPVVVLREPGPGGVTANFERAIAATRGDVVVLSDQDDEWMPDRIERTRSAFEGDEGLDFLFADADLVDASGASLGLTLFGALEMTTAERTGVREGRAFEVLLRRNLATGAASAVRRRAVDRALPFPPEWVHDEWLAMVSAITGRIALGDVPVIRYRQHGRNQIGMRTPGLRQKIARVLEPRGGRNRALAARAKALAERLAEHGLTGDQGIAIAAREKAVFESIRAAMPSARHRRIGVVLALAITGRYGRFASRGTADILRDVLQPDS